MMRLIDNILIWLNRLAEEQGKTIAELHLDFDEVLSGTGPSAFTKAILAEMSISEGESITWNHFHDLVDTQLVGGILVLPSEAFAAGTGHSRSGNHKGSRALVKHHFHASSWTSKHQRFKHPVYDEIEKCNWDVDCIALWDTNVAFYDSLAEEEQLQMIELKRLDDARSAKVAQIKEAAEQVPVVDNSQDDELEDADTEQDASEEKQETDGKSGTKEEDAMQPPLPLPEKEAGKPLDSKPAEKDSAGKQAVLKEKKEPLVQEDDVQRKDSAKEGDTKDEKQAVDSKEGGKKADSKD